jgi:two-component system, chemotaxis family, response regulator Rcp1
MRQDRELQILLVEDNMADARLTMEAFKSSQLAHSVNHALDGVEALEFLCRQGKYLDAPRPDLILLDLNMPRKDGREVLMAIKNDPRLKRIPVVVLTTSDAQEDILRAYALYANCYVCKPMQFDDFNRVIKSIEDFWLTTVKLPPSE